VASTEDDAARRILLRKEMMEALVDAGNSLSPGRRSSITTLMPSVGYRLDADVARGKSHARIGGGSVVGQNANIGSHQVGPVPQAVQTSRLSVQPTKPVIHRSNTNSRIDSPAHTPPQKPDSPPPTQAIQPPAFGSRSRPAAGRESSSGAERADNAESGQSSSASSSRKLHRQRPRTSHVAVGSSASLFGSKSLQADSDHDSNSNSSGGNNTPLVGDGKVNPSTTRSTGTGGGTNIGNGRPGWEGEAIVDVLRQDGIQGERARHRREDGAERRVAWDASAIVPDDR
jgi:hypothetical protein